MTALQFADYRVYGWCYIAVHCDWEVQQMDMPTAFLYADSDEKVFVEEPPGFEPQDKDRSPLK